MKLKLIANGQEEDFRLKQNMKRLQDGQALIQTSGRGEISGTPKKTIIPLTITRQEGATELTRVHLWGAILPEQVRIVAWI